jgi:hypothetical protein
MGAVIFSVVVCRLRNRFEQPVLRFVLFRSEYSEESITDDDVDNDAQAAAFVNAMQNEFYYSQVRPRNRFDLFARFNVFACLLLLAPR